MDDPISCSKYMAGSKAQISLRITEKMIDAATYNLEHVDSNCGYQAEAKYKAAKRWIEAIEKGDYVWLGVAGAATPIGFGGLIADMISRGLIDVIVSTGANAYHDLHFACGLPVRHGSHRVDDEDLRRDGTTRIYTQFIHRTYTLKAQDMVDEDLGRRIANRLKKPFSTARLLYELGTEMLNDPEIKGDKEGSFVLKAAEYGVPVFLDSGSNHSLGMDFSLLFLEGIDIDTSPSKDILEAAALSIYTQPQLNIFLGEGGVRNFIQTTAPTAAEIFYLDFEGSSGCIRFTTADERTGGLSGSGESEGVSWGKYIDAKQKRETVVWGEYTTTAPNVFAYVARYRRKPRRLMDNLDDICGGFIRKIKEREGVRIAAQDELRKILPFVIKNEMEARRKVGEL